MNLLPTNKFTIVALISFVATLSYWAFGFYFIHLLPYHNAFKTASAIYTPSIFLFFGLVALFNLYSIITFIRAKWRKKEMSPPSIIGPVISLTILAVFTIKPFMPTILPSGSHLQKFDSDLWIADDSTLVREGITDRQKMLGDVFDNILPGKSRNDIIRLLGLSSDDSHQPTLRFYLGPARGDFSGLHIEFLRVHFDSSGHYENSSIVLDD